ncbi:hypothetical protein M758_UG134200 [Ceratodon purpureus]|nr:hypothetical protein M758_UG134200 [Ceratodon purpureus]
MCLPLLFSPLLFSYQICNLIFSPSGSSHSLSFLQCNDMFHVAGGLGSGF